ncbi:MAG: hypothetical protein HOW73_47030 [Polyangiaceae bacterium]|nr:hypothetical protein [Polyangiaceae bacterium]
MTDWVSTPHAGRGRAEPTVQSRARLRPKSRGSARAAAATVFVLGALSVIGCRRKEEAEDNEQDCVEICDRYSECFDANYNTAACERRCYDGADRSLNYEFQVDRCATCLTDLTCELIEITECKENCAVITDEPLL